MKSYFPGLPLPHLVCILLIFPFGGATYPETQSSPASARPMPATAFKIISVKETGSKRFTSQEVAASSGLPVGTIAHEEDFKKAARQLGESGAFSNVSYTYSYSASGTKLEYQVTDADKFVPARFADFVWFSDKELVQKLHERIPLFDGELPTTGRLADEVSDVLQAMLVEGGIPGIVEYVRGGGQGEHVVSIDYNVAGVSVRIHHAEFPGASAAELPLLQAAADKLSNREYSRAYMNSFIEHSLIPIYHEHGYLKATCAPAEPHVVKPASSDATASDTNENGPRPTYVDVTFPVTPGVQYKVTGWQWSGNKAFTTAELDPLLRGKAGEPADTVQLESDLRNVQELYGSRGYVTATIKANAIFDDEAGTVAYRFAVDEGSVFHMGELELRGIDNELSARLRAAWKLRPGDVYDATYLKQFLPEAQKLLPARLDWDVAPHVTALAREKTVDVDLEYTAKAPR